MFFLLQRESVDLAIELLDESEYKGSVIHVEQVMFAAIFTENLSSFLQPLYSLWQS